MADKPTGARTTTAFTLAHPLAAGTVPNWMETVSECQRELMEFASNRIAKDNEVIRQILASTSPREAFKAQSLWARETVADYSAEASRILSICARHQPTAQ